MLLGYPVQEAAENLAAAQQQLDDIVANEEAAAARAARLATADSAELEQYMEPLHHGEPRLVSRQQYDRYMAPKPSGLFQGWQELGQAVFGDLVTESGVSGGCNWPVKGNRQQPHVGETWGFASAAAAVTDTSTNFEAQARTAVANSLTVSAAAGSHDAATVGGSTRQAIAVLAQQQQAQHLAIVSSAAAPSVTPWPGGVTDNMNSHQRRGVPDASSTDDAGRTNAAVARTNEDDISVSRVSRAPPACYDLLKHHVHSMWASLSGQPAAL